MAQEVLQVDETGGLVTLTLNRPEQANALSTELVGALQDALDDLYLRSDVRVVIIQGAGQRAFCAGADLKERRSMDEQQARQAVGRIKRVVNSVAALPMPVIAAVNGVAFGGGTELALACDLRIAGESAKFGLTETSLGIIPGAGGTQRLPRLIGLAKAKELIYTARRIEAREALELGLVSQVVHDGELHQTAVRLAEEIAGNAPIAVRQAKFAIDRGFEVDLTSGLALEDKAYEVVIPTSDRLEGLAAFAEKRKPRYQGK
ncbi:enoyl-CoA hydratase [Alicyclobacillus tolerans]|uniref:enoyl-CoA hydratase n=1 Tax=Alicyclobacillus tolerans TaxID=90970 RepID=UPI001F0005AF|nr:enoyl-CoA hydratase [Alicyclobacillus tolerans]MCF8564489.1 enoyl-CoA hydratase [Alicyclobacillus tolerans]